MVGTCPWQVMVDRLDNDDVVTNCDRRKSEVEIFNY